MCEHPSFSNEDVIGGRRRDDDERGLGRLVARPRCAWHPIFQDHGDVYDTLVVAAGPQEPRLLTLVSCLAWRGRGSSARGRTGLLEGGRVRC